MNYERIKLANERMSIVQACHEIGMWTPDIPGAMKMNCPFEDIWHSDGGRARAFRIYEDTNSAYCFACQQYYNPVKLISLERDISEEQAAEVILELTGYAEPSVDEAWAEVTREQEFSTETLPEALKVACQRISPAWETRQFEESVATKFRQCLGLLPKVRSEADATLWLDTSRKIMRNVLGES